MNLKTLIDKKQYDQFSGSSWPKYEDFISGVTVPNEIKAEIDLFVDVAKERYRSLRIGEGNQLADENQKRQNQTFVNKILSTDRQCRVPWETMGINANGEMFICMSPSWIPKFVGSILSADVYDCLNSETAKNIRREILAGRYYYCNNKICSFFGSLKNSDYTIGIDTEPTTQKFNDIELTVNEIPKNIIFDFDVTCNFKCPSCRTEVINHNNDHLRSAVNYQIVEKIKHQVIDIIKEQPISIRWAGGEPFLSKPYLEIFEYIIKSKKSNIQNIIQTNGSYLRSKTVRRLLPYIAELRISFDAATELTYSKTRINGNWKKLLDNVEYIKQLKDTNGYSIKLVGDFVVQKDNYHEIPEFVALCQSLGLDSFHLQKLWNWGTWDTETFHDKNVYNVNHPEYKNLKRYFAIAQVPIQNG